VNRRIREQTEANIARYHGATADEIEQRLDRLDEEWDVDRALMASFATAVLLGTGLTVLGNRKWLALAAASGFFMAIHTLKGWCPPLPVFRRLGFRTQAEIDEERFALTCDRQEIRMPKEAAIEEAIRNRIFPL
jgi:hypothetical protein